ncbi:MAG: hypothetical protein GQ583_01150 [Methyloprofundus sp.]|nr:hypothetical protein [Methyloprofundus sp.]
MKLFCLFILLINISFFFWEYRKGAPEIYQPQEVTAYVSRGHDTEQIFLLSELPPEEKNTIQVAVTTQRQEVATEELTLAADFALDVNDLKVQSIDNDEGLLLSSSLAELKIADALSTYLAQEFIPPVHEQFESVIDKNYKQKIVVDEPPESIDELRVKNAISGQQASFIGPPAPTSPLTTTTLAQQDDIAEKPTSGLVQNTACYILQKSKYKQEMQTLVNSDSNFKLKFIDQEQEYISSYLVLTSAADSLQQAKQQASSIQQQGIEELWLFRQGEFKWRISLGLFSSKAKAVKARKNYAQQITQVLNIVPSIRKKKNIIVNVTTAKAFMTDFESEFSVFIDKKISCTSND